LAKKKVATPVAETEIVMSQSDLEKSFKMATAAVDKEFESVFHAFLYEEEKLVQKRFSSGSISMDMAMGGEGLPYGRIIEVWGPEGSGKTSLALEIAWNLQQATGKAVVFIDVEHKFDKMLLKNWKGVGFLPKMTRYEEPFSGEDAFRLLDSYVQNPATGIVIMDSISGIRSSAVLDADDQQTHFGKQAKLISDYLPKISGSSSRSGVPIMFVNQVRANLEASAHAKGRYKLTKSGGKAYGHYVCISMYVDKMGGKNIITDGVKDLGHWCNVWVYKNHAGPTVLKNFQLCLRYGYGFDTVAELVDVGIKLGLIAVSGSWCTYGEHQAQGKENFIILTRDNKELENKLWEAIKQTQKIMLPAEPSAVFDEEDTTYLNNDEGIEIVLPENAE
jgi:recombination protein RecA